MKMINKMQSGRGKHSCLNNQGFAISGIMYAILIISLLLVLGTLKTLQNRKTIVDKLKSETVNAADSNNYQELLNRVVALENNTSAKINLPIGSIHISVTDDTVDKVKTHFEGEWESFGQGRTIFGFDATQDEFNAVEKNSGSLTHNHSLEAGYAKLNWSGGYIYGFYKTGLSSWNSGSSRSISATTGSNSSMTAAISLGGTTDDTSILPPYITVYMWKRTS